MRLAQLTHIQVLSKYRQSEMQWKILWDQPQFPVERFLEVEWPNNSSLEQGQVCTNIMYKWSDFKLKYVHADLTVGMVFAHFKHGNVRKCRTHQ